MNKSPYILALALSQTAFPATLAVDARNTSATHNGTSRYPYATIQAAIAAAAPKDTVKVAGGVYDSVHIEKSLVLLGGYPGAKSADYQAGTDGDFSTRGKAADSSVLKGTKKAAVVNLDASDMVLDGFTIRDGYRGIDFFGWEEIARITISNNVIEFNGDAKDTEQNGGGIAFHGTDVAILNNVIRDNVAGNRGAAIARNGTLTGFRIEGNTIQKNIGHGDHAGGLYLDGTGLIARNIIEGNRCCASQNYGWGGGVFIFGYGKGHVRMTGNIIRNNFAKSIGGGIFIDEGGKATLDHELIYGNATEAAEKGGAAIYVDESFDNIPSEATLVNCTVVNNRSPGTDGGNGLYVEFSGRRVFVSNSIFWGNGDDFFLRTDSDQVVMNHSISQEAWPGTGNISKDPLFADTAAGDFHLKSTAGRWQPEKGGNPGQWILDPAGSPGIDAGHPDSAYALEPAPNGGRIEMGAYGNTASASKSGSSGIFSRADAMKSHFGLRSAPNPVRSASEIRFVLPIGDRVSLTLLDWRGREIRSLHDGRLEAGTHKVGWRRDGLAQGVYFTRLRAFGETLSERIVILD